MMALPTWYWFLIAGIILLWPTAYAGLIGAPYAPTRIKAVKRAFELLDVGPDDVVVDLGVGDGKILLAAAARGAKAYGYEMSPIFFAIAWVRSRGKKVSIRLGNFYKQNYSDATIIFAFLMPQHMAKVEAVLRAQDLAKAEYVLAYAFPFKNLEPTSVVREKNCAPLYVYDAALFKK